MREKLYNYLKKIYGILMSIAFFGGLLPLIPFLIAIVVGGTWAENVSQFLYKGYYPWVIALASIGVLIGLIAMYIGKLEAFSAKSIDGKKKG